MTPDTDPELDPERRLPAPERQEALPSSAPAGELPPPGDRHRAKPVHLPEPTYWPFFLAIGITFIAWGLISTWVITTGGVIVVIIALVGWINILRHEEE